MYVFNVAKQVQGAERKTIGKWKQLTVFRNFLQKKFSLL